MNELRAQATALGLNTNTVPTRTRVTRTTKRVLNTYRGRGGRANFSHVTVDHRPTSLLVSGYETEEKAEVLAHFQVCIESIIITILNTKIKVNKFTLLNVFFLFFSNLVK